MSARAVAQNLARPARPKLGFGPKLARPARSDGRPSAVLLLSVPWRGRTC